MLVTNPILQIMNFRRLKIAYLWQGKKRVPRINISGQWLKNAGFEIGNNIELTISNNQIIIKNAD